MARNRAQTNASSSPATDKNPVAPEVPAAVSDADDSASKRADSDSETPPTLATQVHEQSALDGNVQAESHSAVPEVRGAVSDAADPASERANPDPEQLSTQAPPVDEQNAPSGDVQSDSESEGDASTEPAAPPVDATGSTTAMYEVLTPFKFRGHPVKPPAWIELAADEAEAYQAAGVLGTEPGEVPSVDGGQDD